MANDKKTSVPNAQNRDSIEGVRPVRVKRTGADEGRRSGHVVADAFLGHELLALLMAVVLAV